MRVRCAIALCVAAYGCSGKSGGTVDAAHAGDGATTVDASLGTGAFCPSGSNGAAQGSATVTFDVDVGAGPVQQQFTGAAIQRAAPIAVSDYIYGINQYPENNYLLNYPDTKFGLLRFGGDSYVRVHGADYAAASNDGAWRLRSEA